MANRADVYVKDLSKQGGFRVFCKQPDGTRLEDTDFAENKKARIHLAGLEIPLVIAAPKEKDTKYCPIRVKSDVAFTLTYSRTHSQWALKIDPNDDPPDAPTTVNVEIGDDEPDIPGEDDGTGGDSGAETT